MMKIKDIRPGDVIQFLDGGKPYCSAFVIGLTRIDKKTPLYAGAFPRIECHVINDLKSPYMNSGLISYWSWPNSYNERTLEGLEMRIVNRVYPSGGLTSLFEDPLDENQSNDKEPLK